MEIKHYSNYEANSCAIAIMADIIDKRVSEGWSGSLEEKEAVEKILNKFNVYYTDDFFGRWKFLIKK